MDPMDDVHICGRCKAQFTSIEAFFGHKRSGCQTQQNSHLPVIANVLKAASLVSIRQSGDVITPVTTTSGPACTPSTTTATRKQKRKPILLATSPKVAQPAAPTCSNAAPTQPCDISTSAHTGQILNNSAPLCIPGLPQTGSVALTPFTAGGNKGTTGNCKSAQGTTAGGKKSTEVKSKAKGEKCYKCLYEGCDFATAHLKDIIRHKRIHTGDRPFTCSFCQHRFTRKDKLQLHIRIHNGLKPFKCEECPYAGRDSGSLKKHMRTHTKERPFKCQICSYASRNSSQLTTHLRIHTGDTPFHCKQCSAKFKIKTDLRRHMRIHTGEKPFKCSLCPYASALNSNLKSHMKNNHWREKNFQCMECNFTCCTKKQLRQHERTHPSQNPIKCMDCDILCQNKRAFRRHKRVHSKETPQKCPHCSYKAKYHSQVACHLKKHHPDLAKQKQPKKAVKRKKPSEAGKVERKRNPKPSTVQLNGKKPFVCDKCTDSFMRKESYMSHMRQHQQDTPTIESAALAVLQLQQLPPPPTTCTVPASIPDPFRHTANPNQNNNSIFSEVSPRASSCASDIEMLLSVINSQAPLPCALDPSTDSTNSMQKQSLGNPTQNVVSTQLLHTSAPAVSLPNASKHGPSINTYSNSDFPSHSITIIQPEHIEGDEVTLEVISHETVTESSSITPEPASTGYNFSGKPIVLRQLPAVRNPQFLQFPQCQPPPIQPTNQQLIRTPMNQSSPQLPVPVGLSVAPRGFLPQFNRTPFSVPHSHDVVGNPTLTQKSQPQGLPNPTNPQGFLQPPSMHQSLTQHASNMPLLSGLLQCTTASSTIPEIYHLSTTSQQNGLTHMNQFQTGLPQPQACTTFSTSSMLPPTNMLQTVTKFPLQHPHVDNHGSQLHVMSQHQVQGTKQPQQMSVQGVAPAPLMGVPPPIGPPMSIRALTQHVTNLPQLGLPQQRQPGEPIRHQTLPPQTSILHVPQLAPISACNTLMSPSAITDINISSLRVKNQGTIIPTAQSATSSAI
ncbi:RE1-silencing transcription factor-like isoform X2 [Patiria miniata]|nr:RE1-silencing transcription factor-like isoform X2 [Patiria miniata]